MLLYIVKVMLRIDTFNQQFFGLKHVSGRNFDIKIDHYDLNYHTLEGKRY